MIDTKIKFDKKKLVKIVDAFLMSKVTDSAEIIENAGETAILDVIEINVCADADSPPVKLDTDTFIEFIAKLIEDNYTDLIIDDINDLDFDKI